MTSARKNFSYLFKILVVLCSLGGVTLSLAQAHHDGFSHWAKRLLYFTAQSNLWIGITCLLLLFLPFLYPSEKTVQRLYLLKFVFTVSIAVTCLVFCGLLGPFADKSMHPWSFSSFLTHVFSPIFALIDYFLDPYPIKLKKGQFVLALLPPLFYVLIASILNLQGIDFGRGDPYPYFFLHYRSPVGLFGFSNAFPFYAGTFYWLALFAFVVFIIAGLFSKAKSHEKKR
ncbi:MAG: hypothetical protein IJX88_06605 [Clostridia bacterium]|nr:hypothetical protein [Clostridia bacterium]